MAKYDARLQELLSAEPAWFAASAAAAPDGDAWDWLTPHPAIPMEVTEFAVSASFIEAMFGSVTTRAGVAGALLR